MTVNQVSQLDNYLIPKIDTLFAEISGCKKFVKLDLKHAYQQMLLDKSSQELLTINTHLGQFKPTRLAFGIKSATGIFQRAIENKLKGLKHALVRVDDVLVGGKDDQELLNNLKSVFIVLKGNGLRLKREKCVFLKGKVCYLGYEINKEGLSPIPKKIDAVLNAPIPKNVTELKAFLSMLNYYHRFLDRLSTILEPLHKLLRKGQSWEWDKAQQIAFEKAKQLLTSTQVLSHYDPAKPLIMLCDASPYGIAAVLSHRMPNGNDRPIAFASKTLTPAKRNYYHLKKEALAIIFGFKKFHEYCFGRFFTIQMDHKPLLGLIGEKKGIPFNSAACIQRWSLFLSNYQHKLVY